MHRLDLLSRITRAIGERQDLESIYQVLVSSLEDQMPADFVCISLHNNVENTLAVRFIGTKSAQYVNDLSGLLKSRFPIQESGMGRCLDGELIYEPKISAGRFPIIDHLKPGKLHSVVMSPLPAESEVFGVLIVARRKAERFSGAECDFLRQLGAHAALAARQAELYGALEKAHKDQRQSQHTVMQHARMCALGEMAGGVVHDINNGLSPILLYTSMLLEHEKSLDAASREQLKIVHRAGSDISAIIARLYQFYQQREPELTLEPVALNILAAQVLGLTRARWHDVAQQRGIQIDVKTQMQEGLPLVLGVESEIREALVNLILNSADAMPKGGTITLRTTATAEAATVHVSDEGTGMDQETRRRCMEPFFTTKGERGTGLGLAMVYGILKRHKGDVDIDSAPGKGTTIRLSFPVRTRESADTAASTNETEALPRLRLLIIDDDPLILKALQDVLELDGHIVVAANGGQTGIEAFKSAMARYQPFSAVITDLGMPNIDGRAVAGAIKAMSSLTPVIMLTGWGKRLKAEGNIPAHIDSLLGKPPRLGELRETLARHISSRHSP